MTLPGKAHWFVIINPTSGGGRADRYWPKIELAMGDQGMAFSWKKSQYPGHAIELVGEALDQGFRDIISVGGDGTLHEIVNAIMRQPVEVQKQCKVGLIPVGTGNDWARQYKLPGKFDMAIERILQNHIKEQDIGVIELIDQSSDPVYFNNLAGAGFDGFVVEKIHKYKHWGALAYLAGAVLSLFSFKNFIGTISNENEAYSGGVFMVVAGIGRYSGGGMQLTSNPSPDDGKLDISLVPSLSKLGVLSLMPKLFNGKAGSDPKVISNKSVKLEVLMNKDEAFIQADGELVGKGSFRIKIIPAALKFYT